GAAGDGPGRVRRRLQEGPPRQLVNLKNIPVLVVMSEASYHASYDHCPVKYLRQAGVTTAFMRLADRDIRGNGHMMMLEKNNDRIAAAMADWLTETIRAEKK